MKKCKFKAAVFAVLVSASLLFTACPNAAKGSGNKTVAVTGVTLNKAKIELTLGEKASEKLTATITPAAAINKQVTWSSSKEDVAIVDADGKVTAKKAGETVITVTTADGGKTATCNVTVKAKTVAVTGVTLNTTKIELTLGEKASEKLTATITPAEATNKQVTWSSNKEDVAIVDADGKVTAKKAGEAVITVTTADGGKTATCNVTVKLNKAVLTLSADKKDIQIKVVTEDAGTVIVEGCTQNSLNSGEDSVLNATGTTVTLKGNITELHCGINKLTALDVQDLTSLRILLCYENELTALNLQGLTALEEADCTENKITGLNVQGLTALKGLTCRENQLETLNVQGLTSLERMDCSANKLKNIELQGLTSLNTLDCSRNKLDSLSLQGCNSLITLVCNENKIKELNLQGFSALKTLRCRKNGLTDLKLQGTASLENLTCDNNALSSLDVQNCNNLKELKCHRNNLTSLNIQGCASLEKLYCEENKLAKEVFIKLFTDLPDRTGKSVGNCYLYTEKTGTAEGNHKTFTEDELKPAKNKYWIVYKRDSNGAPIKLT